MNTKHNIAFGNVLRDLRRDRNWSQEYLGFEASLSRAYISLLERGQRSATLDTVFLLSNALEVPVITIFTSLSEKLSDASS